MVDASSAGQTAPQVTLKKEVAESGTNCQTATWVTNIPTYHPGDTICWRLSINFPSKVDTHQLRVTDFLPRNAAYVPGSYQDTSGNTTINTIDTADSSDGVLFWDINGSYVPVGSQKFQVTFKTTIEPSGILSPVDIEGNLMKFAFENTPGTSFPLRDQVDFKTVARPEADQGCQQDRLDELQSSRRRPDSPRRKRRHLSGRCQVDRRYQDVQVWDPAPGRLHLLHGLLDLRRRRLRRRLRRQPHQVARHRRDQ